MRHTHFGKPLLQQLVGILAYHIDFLLLNVGFLRRFDSSHKLGYEFDCHTEMLHNPARRFKMRLSDCRSRHHLHPTTSCAFNLIRHKMRPSSPRLLTFPPDLAIDVGA